MCSGAVCGQTCGQRALLDQVRYSLPPPIQKGSFLCSGLGHCNSGKAWKQVISAPQRINFWHSYTKNTVCPKASNGCVVSENSVFIMAGGGLLKEAAEGERTQYRIRWNPLSPVGIAVFSTGLARKHCLRISEVLKILRNRRHQTIDFPRGLEYNQFVKVYDLLG